MADITDEWTGDEIAAAEVSDDALEAAASKGSAGGYTQFGLCTVSACTPNVTLQILAGRKLKDATG